MTALFLLNRLEIKLFVNPHDRRHSSCGMISAIRKEFVCFKISTVFATADLGDVKDVEALRSDLVKVAEEFVFRGGINNKRRVGLGILRHKLIDNLLPHLEGCWTNSRSEPR